jgi:prepilin-type N-terminal cleavage/methylation domain-containing protein
MSINNKINQKIGFTIVELLVVIVVIGILAAITLVSYSGITARANSASAQTTASDIIGKITAYTVDSPAMGYPSTLSAISGAATTASYYYNSATLDGTILSSGNLPTKPSEVNFFRCGTGATTAAPADYASITTNTGVKIGYWDYVNAAIVYQNSGVVSGTVGTYNVACFISAS